MASPKTPPKTQQGPSAVEHIASVALGGCSPRLIFNKYIGGLVFIVGVGWVALNAMPPANLPTESNPAATEPNPIPTAPILNSSQGQQSQTTQESAPVSSGGGGGGGGGGGIDWGGIVNGLVNPSVDPETLEKALQGGSSQSDESVNQNSNQGVPVQAVPTLAPQTYSQPDVSQQTSNEQLVAPSQDLRLMFQPIGMTQDGLWETGTLYYGGQAYPCSIPLPTYQQLQVGVWENGLLEVGGNYCTGPSNP